MTLTPQQKKEAQISLNNYVFFDFRFLCESIIIFFKSNSDLISIPEYKVDFVGSANNTMSLGVDIYLDEQQFNSERGLAVGRFGFSVRLLLDAGSHSNNLQAEAELADKYQRLCLIASKLNNYLAKKKIFASISELHELGLTTTERAADKYYATVELKGSFGILRQQ